MSFPPFPHPMLGRSQSSGGPPDPFFANVELLLHMDGADGDTTLSFVDSASGLNVTAFGGEPAQGSLSPYASGGGSCYFDGAATFLTVPAGAAHVLGTGDVAVEFFAKLSTIGNIVLFDSVYNITAGSYPVGSYQIFTSPTGQLSLTLVNGASTVLQVASATALVANTWTHVALVRSGGVFRWYIGGVVDANTMAAAGVPFGINHDAYIGQQYVGSVGTQPKGYLSDLRFSNSAVYTGNFTPPSAPLTVLGSTKLLFSFANGKVLDSARKHNVVTPGLSALRSAQAKFGNTSLDPIGAVHVPEFPAIGTQDFTVEGWAQRTSTGLGAAQILLCGVCATATDNVAGQWTVRLSSSDVLQFTEHSTQAVNFGTWATTGVWAHIAISRVAGVVYAFKDGVLINTGGTAFSTALNGGILGVGSASALTSAFRGYLDDLRITIGVGRYTASFTPPSAPYGDSA